MLKSHLRLRVTFLWCCSANQKRSARADARLKVSGWRRANQTAHHSPKDHTKASTALRRMSDGGFRSLCCLSCGALALVYLLMFRINMDDGIEAEAAVDDPGKICAERSILSAVAMLLVVCVMRCCCCQEAHP